MKAEYHAQVGVLRDKEIDFIATKNSKTLYIQVAFNLETKATFDREFNNLLTLKNNNPKSIITMYELPYSEKEGIQFVPAWELSDYLEKV
jgi:predicted AAA+ superfamily ATPase